MLAIVFAMMLAAAGQSEPAPVPAEIEAAGPEGALRGSILLPADQAPVVLILPASGPTDRDGNSSLGIRAAPYRLLAEDLVRRGIGSVRIDKRGTFGSRGAAASANAVTIDDYVRDTRAWIGAIRARTGVACVWLAGHSEGGLIALATMPDATDICGLILIATVGRSLGAVLKEQLRADPGNASLLAAADAAIDALSAGKRVDTAKLPAALVPLFAASKQDFLASILVLDPADLIRRADRPILILQGTRDLQVSIEDARLLHDAAPVASLVILSDTNHVLKRVHSDQRRENLRTYADPRLPLAPGVSEAIVDFIGSADGRADRIESTPSAAMNGK